MQWQFRIHGPHESWCMILLGDISTLLLIWACQSQFVEPRAISQNRIHEPPVMIALAPRICWESNRCHKMWCTVIDRFLFCRPRTRFYYRNDIKRNLSRDGPVSSKRFWNNILISFLKTLGLDWRITLINHFFQIYKSDLRVTRFVHPVASSCCQFYVQPISTYTLFVLADKKAITHKPKNSY